MSNGKFKLVPASYLVLIKNNKILLLKRFNTGFMDGQYSLVAGHVEEKEGFTKTIIREAEEEANIVIKEPNIKVAHIMNRFEPQEEEKDKDLRERIDVFFEVNEWEGEIKNMEPNKCGDLNWFPLDNLPKNTIPYIKEAINNIQMKKFYSEFGY